MNKIGLKPRIVSVILTAVVLTTLLLAGPVQAFVLGFTATSETDVIMGQNVTFQAVADFDDNEMRDITFFVVDFDGPVSISCSFFPDGTTISSCNGFDIELIENSTDGFGYGYGYGVGGKLIYNITVNTANYPEGTYGSKFIAFGNGLIEQDGPVITVTEQAVILESCSVRAHDGQMKLNGQPFGRNNNINFNIPKSTANKGQGSVTAQANGQRFNYKFDVEDIISNINGNSTIAVSGDYRVQRNNDIPMDAIIYLSKPDQSVTIVADDFNVTFFDITFIKGC